MECRCDTNSSSATLAITDTVKYDHAARGIVHHNLQQIARSRGARVLRKSAFRLAARSRHVRLNVSGEVAR